MEGKRYIAIDLKSFYASVECVERGLDPLDTCLAVADASRTEKTICLAVSPALKGFGLGGRPRLFEVVRRVRELNRGRGHSGKSCSARELSLHKELAIDYVTAKPRMSLYIDYSTRIYNIYLRHIAPEDIHVYSIDEVFIDATPYLATYGLTAHELALKIIREVLGETGITATAGIGTNMYLCKIAMDIMAKRMPPDKDGVRIAELDEMSYRRELWDHTPISDFWRIGRGTAARLARHGMHTMGDVARRSIDREDELYRLLGVNAELLIDHAWGWEPVTMAQVKAYRPENHSLCLGQVLKRPYGAKEGKVVALEMAENLAFELLDKGLLTDQIVLQAGYDAESLSDPEISAAYKGRVGTDRYGRKVPFHTHGSSCTSRPTMSVKVLTEMTAELYDKTVNPLLLLRRLTLTAQRVITEAAYYSHPHAVQLDLFEDPEETRRRKEAEKKDFDRERRRHEAVLRIKKQFGRNSILRGLSYAEGATQRERNTQIGGHHE